MAEAVGICEAEYWRKGKYTKKEPPNHHSGSI